MKKFWKYIMITAAAVALMPLTACDDDDVDPYDISYAYVYQPNSTFARVEYKANGEFIVGITDPLKVMPVRSTKPANGNVKIEVAIDPSLVDEYNEANETNYKFLEGAEIINPQMIIADGEYVSADSITVGFTDHSGFLTGETDLILPIVIRSAGGGMTISKSSRIFLTFNSTYNPLVISTKQEAKFAACPSIDGWEQNIQSVTVDNAITASYTPFEPITVDLRIDGSKVNEYNTANGTSYAFKSDARLASNKITLGTEDLNGSFTINSGSLTDFANGQSYLIPVVVENPQGCRAELTGNTVVYVLLRSTGPELIFSTTADNSRIEFALPAETTCTVNGSPTYNGGWNNASWVDIINSNNSSYGYMSRNDVMEINFGKTFNLTSIYFNCWSGSYAPRSIALQTSANGTDWFEWETTAWTTAAGKFYIDLPFAYTTQYIKLHFPTGASSIDIEGLRFYEQ